MRGPGIDAIHSVWGGFRIKQLRKRGVVVGLAAECKEHFEEGNPNDCQCSLLYESERAPLTEEEAWVRLKRWLTKGFIIPAENGRPQHTCRRIHARKLTMPCDEDEIAMARASHRFAAGDFEGV